MSDRTKNVLAAICFFLWFCGFGCNTQTVKRLETHVGSDVTYEDSYRVVTVPLIGGKNEAVHNFEKTGLNNIRAGQVANSDTTATAALLNKIADIFAAITVKAAGTP